MPISKNIDKSNHIWIGSLSNKKLLKDIESYYAKAKNKQEIEVVMENWCQSNKFQNDLLQINEGYPTEAVFYDTKETRPLVSKFLNNTQTWSALSSYQLYELNISFLNYTDKLTEDQKKKLFKRLKRTAYASLKK